MESTVQKERIILAGGSGFLGTRLTHHFAEQGYDVVILSRAEKEERNGIRYRQWDGKKLGEWTEEIDGAKAVINLSGKSIDCRHTPANQAQILSSRLDTTNAIGEAVAQCTTPPAVWMNASAIAIYPESYENDMTEDSDVSDVPGFTAEVCRKWEAALTQYGCSFTRKVALRISVVLEHNMGAMKPLTTLTRFGLGGYQGSGNQYMSWIHIDDFMAAIEFILQNDDMEGPINLVSPNPVTNKVCMAAFRKVLKRPFGVSHPRFLLEIGAFFIRTETVLVLSSARITPERLMDAGFTFHHRDIEGALRDLLNK